MRNPKKHIWVVTNRMGVITHAATTYRKARREGRLNDKLRPDNGPSLMHAYSYADSSETIGLRYTAAVHQRIADEHSARMRRRGIPKENLNMRDVYMVQC